MGTLDGARCKTADNIARAVSDLIIAAVKHEKSSSELDHTVRVMMENALSRCIRDAISETKSNP